MGAIANALRDKFRRPEAALRALGIDITEPPATPPATQEPRMPYTRDYRRGRDEEPYERARQMRDEIAEVCDDPEADFGDILGVILHFATPEQAAEVAEAARELAGDRRGPRRWGQDRREWRQLSRDRRLTGRPRRFGRDQEEMMEPRGGTETPRIERFGEYHNAEAEARDGRHAGDRHRLAGDRLAYDRSAGTSSLRFQRSPSGIFRVAVE